MTLKVFEFMRDDMIDNLSYNNYKRKGQPFSNRTMFANISHHKGEYLQKKIDTWVNSI